MFIIFNFVSHTLSQHLKKALKITFGEECKTMHLLILQFSPISCYFVPLIIHNCYSMITALQMLLVDSRWKKKNARNKKEKTIPKSTAIRTSLISHCWFCHTRYINNQHFIPQKTLICINRTVKISNCTLQSPDVTASPRIIY
jgi:hypothetical protein